jgi:hypothetical protein
MGIMNEKKSIQRSIQKTTKTSAFPKNSSTSLNPQSVRLDRFSPGASELGNVFTG